MVARSPRYQIPSGSIRYIFSTTRWDNGLSRGNDIFEAPTFPESNNTESSFNKGSATIYRDHASFYHLSASAVYIAILLVLSSILSQPTATFFIPDDRALVPHPFALFLLSLSSSSLSLSLAFLQFIDTRYYFFFFTILFLHAIYIRLRLVRVKENDILWQRELILLF